MKQIGFIHIPKTGGTYLSQYETTNKPVMSGVKRLGHVYVLGNNAKEFVHPFGKKGYFLETISKEELKSNYYVITVVRNPFTWLVSYYGHAAGFNPKYRNVKHYDYRAASKGFEYLLKTIANREDKWPCRKMLFCQCWASDGELIVDYVFNQEKLAEQLKEFAGSHGLSFTDGENQRDGMVGKTNDDYFSYYNDELIGIVVKTWARDFILFGYDLTEMGRLREYGALRGNDTRLHRRQRYLWIGDRFE